MTNLQEARPAVASVTPGATAHPSFWQAFRFWLKLGFISFGGPTGQIAIMHEELVERKRWISDSRFLHALNYCMLLPGPEAQQLAVYVGWLLHRVAGGIVAGSLFVIPSIFILWTLSYVYVTYGAIPWVASIFYGLKPAVTAIVAAAVIRIGRKALKTPVMWLIAAAAFVAIFFLRLPFPLIVLGAGAIGLLGGRLWRSQFLVIRAHDDGGAVLADAQEASEHTCPSWARTLRVGLVCLMLWWAPIAALGAWLGRDSVPFREGVFFSKAAMVTFGGAYAVLPYVAQKAVQDYGWLSTAQMVDGLGLAETTPGPLIMVVQFVGFLGGWSHPGGLPPLAAATLGALITTWATFLPSFLWIFLGAPHIERLRGNERLSTALSAITAAVVGVVLNLAVWFGIHVLRPAGVGLDAFAIAVAAVTFIGLVKWRWQVVYVVVGSGLAGLVYRAWVA
jgi:chromate transporter